MSKKIGSQTNFSAGISFSQKEGVANSFAFGSAIDHRTDPTSVSLNPKAEKDSGNIVTSLPIWGARACNRIYAYAEDGTLYKKENDEWSLAHKAAESSGNGLAYFTEDNALYYAQDKTFGRILDACTQDEAYDDFLGSEGGQPTNTRSLQVLRASSEYRTAPDSSSLSITADLTLEAYARMETLPGQNEKYTMISKWNENSQRSYTMDIINQVGSGIYGDGRDGALSITSNTTDDPIDANCSGTQGSKSLTLYNEHALFSTLSAGDKVLIHQTRGTNANAYQVATVERYASGTLTLVEQLSTTFYHVTTQDNFGQSAQSVKQTGAENKAQVLKLKQYTTVSVSSGVTYSAKSWDGLKGGILGFLANVSATGTYSAQAKGFRGGVGFNLNGYPAQGEGFTGWNWTREGAPDYSGADQPNGNGGGATKYGAGASGGNATAGNNGVKETTTSGSTFTGVAGSAAGSTDLTTIAFGGGAAGSVGNNSQLGGRGGGVLFIYSPSITSATFNVQGESRIGIQGWVDNGPSGGAGGSLYVKTDTIAHSTYLIGGGAGGLSSGGSPRVNGVNGASGRAAIYYSTAVTNSTSGAHVIYIKDNVSGGSSGYLLRLGLSSTGANEEYIAWDISNILQTKVWSRWQISYENSSKVVSFYRNGVLLGTKQCTYTSLRDSTALLGIGANFNSSSAAQNFFNGQLDDLRIWNDVRTASELLFHNDQVLYGTEANLVAYYKFENNQNDSQTNVTANTLTSGTTPVYSVLVPFSGVTSRLDEDQINNQTGSTYALGTTISEAAADRQTFTPKKDPQKSIQLDIAAKGTGDWTVTIHDSLNREVASVTVANSELFSGVYEFVFDEVWRPIIGATYHFHVKSTVADGTLVSGVSNDLETGRFWTHYQFLIDDQYHPIAQHLDFMVIGNERYLAKFQAGDAYDPHRLVFPSGYRVRSLAFWREFLVIGCWRGESITDSEDGRLFFWDGVSDTYNHSVPVPEGGINAMFGSQDVLFVVAGYTGEILIYTGGGAAQKFNKIPFTERNKYIEVCPGSIAMWRSIINFGVGLNTNSESVYKGVYTLGTLHRQYPASFGFEYPTSLGTQTRSSVRVGMVYPSGQDLYVGWQNTNAYGIDKISVTNDPYAAGELWLLIQDMQQISREKYPLTLRADFEPLREGERVRLKYRPDRETLWRYSLWEDSIGAQVFKLRVSERVREIQVAVEIETTVSTSPTVIGISLETEFEEGSSRNA